MTFSEHIGMRIRLYRKAKGLSLTQLSQQINKSVSCVSKYESGSIVIDVETLYEIAQILSVSVNQLTDYQPPESKKTVVHGKDFFHTSDLFFIYYYFAIEKKVYISAMEILRSPSRNDEAVFYCDISDTKSYTNCNYLFHGTLTYSDLHVQLLMENANNSSDVEFAFIKMPFTIAKTTTGILTMISQRLRNPCSLKILVSQQPLETDDSLIQELTVSDKPAIASLKTSNMFVIQ